MSLNMRQKMPFILDYYLPFIELTEDQKFASSPGWNRINHHERMLQINLEFKENEVNSNLIRLDHSVNCTDISDVRSLQIEETNGRHARIGTIRNP